MGKGSKCGKVLANIRWKGEKGRGKATTLKTRMGKLKSSGKHKRFK